MKFSFSCLLDTLIQSEIQKTQTAEGAVIQCTWTISNDSNNT